MPFLTKGETNWKYILIVVILAIIVGGGILTYQYWWLPRQEIKPPEVKSPEEVIEHETANWKTYRNEEYEFEVKYPGNWEYNAGPLPEVFLFGTTGVAGYDINVWVKSSSQLNEFYENKTEICAEDFLADKKAYKCEGDKYIYIEAESNGKFYFLSVTGDKLSEKFDIFNQMLSSFQFIEVEKFISKEEATNLVVNLPKVQKWLALFTGPGGTGPTTGGKPIIELDSKSDEGYTIHVYEQLSDHTATFNWYSVNSKTGEIVPMFDF